MVVYFKSYSGKARSVLRPETGLLAVRQTSPAVYSTKRLLAETGATWTKRRTYSSFTLAAIFALTFIRPFSICPMALDSPASAIFPISSPLFMRYFLSALRALNYKDYITLSICYANPSSFWFLPFSSINLPLGQTDNPSDSL